MSYSSAAVLQMPSSYVPMSTEEMEYVEGGDFYISNRNLKNVLAACAINPVASVFVAIGYYKVCAMITGSLAAIGAKFGALGGAVGSAAGLCIGVLAAKAVAGTIFDAIVQGKGINIAWKRIAGKVPYGVSITVQ